MIGIGPGARVMVATRPVDFRKGPDALAALVGAEYGGDPFSGVIYVFRAKRSDRVKLVWWDGTGLCLMAKKLESGGFKWPAIQDGVMRLTSAQLGALLEGLDWRRVHGGRKPIAPQIAGRCRVLPLIHCLHAGGSGPARRHRSASRVRARAAPQAGRRDGRQGRGRCGDRAAPVDHRRVHAPPVRAQVRAARSRPTRVQPRRCRDRARPNARRARGGYRQGWRRAATQGQPRCVARTSRADRTGCRC